MAVGSLPGSRCIFAPRDRSHGNARPNRLLSWEAYVYYNSVKADRNWWSCCPWRSMGRRRRRVLQ